MIFAYLHAEEIRLGELCADTGLGLIRQPACVMLQASGIRVVGVDSGPGITDAIVGNCWLGVDAVVISRNGQCEGIRATTGSPAGKLAGRVAWRRKGNGMRLLSQKLKDGTMKVVEVPVPGCAAGSVLVRNFYSVISAGTEASTVSAARKSLIGKAKERPQQVKQVFEVLKAQGPLQTYRAVMKKLDAWSPLGYSSVGEVIDQGPEVIGIRVGDLVACGGLGACHAEMVSVPSRLCVKLPYQNLEAADLDAWMKSAAYNTLGAIALQGVRQADLRLGETCCVIGLGLLGQLTCLLLRASGIRVAGVDINPAMVTMARDHCADLALERNEANPEDQILAFTQGIGCDAVNITAAADSPDPINFAGAIARKRGTVVVVGAVPTGFDRDPHYYRKELQVRMSCSYGPGRYDPEYEDKGRDYPVGYVRWTENRNMQAFQDLIASRKIDPSYLTTHVFKLEDAPGAYDMILEKSEPFVGILIEYDRKRAIGSRSIAVKTNASDPGRLSSINIGFIGAGSYAQSHLLPNIPAAGDLVLKGVMTSTSAGARSVADRFGFEFCTGSAEDVLDNAEINTMFIASRHDSHASYVKRALAAGKHVFVEKPLCLTIEELNDIEDQLKACSSNPTAGLSSPPMLMVGYNRRFSSLSRILKAKLGQGPYSMLYRINAGHIPPESWIQDKDVGGGRVLGEVCHFIDYLTFVSGCMPSTVFAAAMDDPFGHQDTLAVSLKYPDGSIGSIQYFANGSKDVAKEYLEVYAHGVTATLKDFREIDIYSKGKPFRKKLLSQDKGQKEEVRRFLDAVRNGGDPPIPVEELLGTSRACFAVLESLRTGASIGV